MDVNTTNNLENEIAKIWISGQKSCTLIIKRELAQEYGLVEPSHVVLERRPEGILSENSKFRKEEEKRWIQKQNRKILKQMGIAALSTFITTSEILPYSWKH
jgi:hypothetical protein